MTAAAKSADASRSGRLRRKHEGVGQLHRHPRLERAGSRLGCDGLRGAGVRRNDLNHVVPRDCTRRCSHLVSVGQRTQPVGWLSRTFVGGLPAEQEEVVPAKRAPIRQQQPVDRFLHDVPYAHAPEFDGFTVGTAGGEQTGHESHHDPASVLDLLCEEGPA